jgi:hypothetical protein
LKLGLVAIITEGLGNNFNSSSHSNVQSGHRPQLSPPLDFPPLQIAAVIASLALAFVICCFVFYLITRLRFAYFHCLVHNTTEIRPGWILYKDRAARFFWLNLGVGFSFLLVIGLIAIPFVSGFVRVFQEYHQGGHLDVSLLLSLVLPLIPLIVLIALVCMLADLILRDCMLPHYALEDASAGDAWFQVWSRIKAEKRQFVAYALLRVVLPIIAAIGLIMLLAIPGLMLAGSVAAVEFGIHSMFADATGSSAIVGKILEGFFGFLAFGFAVLAGICLGGPVSTAVREFALVFYGGRYKELGDTLYPPSVPPAIA